MSDEIILYTSPEGNKRVAAYYQGETVWLTQKQLAELYNVDRSVISKHLGKIFTEGELKEDSVCAIFALSRLPEKEAGRRHCAPTKKILWAWRHDEAVCIPRPYRTPQRGAARCPPQVPPF